ncbi:MAG TPA: ethanolamine permease [Cytophagaceae bacterium]|jgi:ethanolamine permease|nr:ethanolamine permease [Cytophagaceae bacterium]
MTNRKAELKPTLGPFMLWGLGVGYVISGMYFGWNLGLAEGGTLGMAIATFFIIIMYVCFTFSYAELACAIPDAGGAFAYASKAFGPNISFVAGMAQIIEFVFAPPAIAAAIGSYLHIFLPSVPVIVISIAAYFAFTLLNISGVKAAASFELVITIFAVAELLIFAGTTLPAFKFENLTRNNFPNSIMGIFASIPFAIWFFLGIEGLANTAEETVNPQKNIMRGFGSALLTLIILCALTFIAAVGVGGWEPIVFDDAGNKTDSPLPEALSFIAEKNGALYHLLVTIGLFGLVASFHGIILAAGRATFEFGRVGNAPAFIGKVHNKFKTPANALIVNMIIGIASLFSGETSALITIAAFGALTLYIISMLSVIRLRRKLPDLLRPFKVPFYPALPLIAFIIGVVSFSAMLAFYFKIAILYFAILIVSFLVFKFKVHSPQSTVHKKEQY